MGKPHQNHKHKSPAKGKAKNDSVDEVISVPSLFPSPCPSLQLCSHVLTGINVERLKTSTASALESLKETEKKKTARKHSHSEQSKLLKCHSCNETDSVLLNQEKLLSQWVADEENPTDKSEQNRLCLYCGFVGCSAHQITHYTETCMPSSSVSAQSPKRQSRVIEPRPHQIVMNTKDYSIHCLTCERELVAAEVYAEKKEQEVGDKVDEEMKEEEASIGLGASDRDHDLEEEADQGEEAEQPEGEAAAAATGISIDQKLLMVCAEIAHSFIYQASHRQKKPEEKKKQQVPLSMKQKMEQRRKDDRILAEKLFMESEGLNDGIPQTEDVAEPQPEQQEEPSGDKVLTAFHGLNNLGNTCFFNSTIQNLVQCKSIVEKFVFKNEPASMAFCGPLSTAFTQFVQRMWNEKESSSSSSSSISPVKPSPRSQKRGKHGRFGGGGGGGHSLTGVVSPSDLFSAVCKSAPRFKGFQQQDSQELLRYLLDGIREEIKKAHGKQADTWVDSVFGVTLQNSIVCHNCASVSVTTEPCLDISVSLGPLPDEDNIAPPLKAKSSTFVPKAKTALQLRREATQAKAAALKALREGKKQASPAADDKTASGGQEEGEEGEKKNQENAAVLPSEGAAQSVEANGQMERQEPDVQRELNGEESELQETEAVVAKQLQQLSLNGNCNPGHSSSNVSSDGDDSPQHLEQNPTTHSNEENAKGSENEAVGVDIEKSQEPEPERILKPKACAEEVDSKLREALLDSSAAAQVASQCPSESVFSCLASFIKPEKLTGENSYYCSHCCTKGQLVDATKQLAVVVNGAAPKVLTLHLKRFEQRGMLLSKNSKHISIPLELDLSPFCAIPAPSAASSSSSLDALSSKKQSLLYRLFGVVEHSGTMRGGHYVSYSRSLKGSDDDLRREHWYHASDSHVRPAEVQEVLNSDAYVLFYEHVDAEVGVDSKSAGPEQELE